VCWIYGFKFLEYVVDKGFTVVKYIFRYVICKLYPPYLVNSFSTVLGNL